MTSLKLSELIEDFDERPGQEGMLQNVHEAYLENQTLLVEAGTGIGKSVAYLLPALLWAKEHGEPTVISTHTIALQEQLLKKDIPLLLDALNLDLNIILLKGMGNYVCLRKEHDGSDEIYADSDSCTNAKCPFYKDCSYFKQKKAAEEAHLIIVNHHLLFADLAIRAETEDTYRVLPPINA